MDQALGSRALGGPVSGGHRCRHALGHRLHGQVDLLARGGGVNDAGELAAADGEGLAGHSALVAHEVGDHGGDLLGAEVIPQVRLERRFGQPLGQPGDGRGQQQVGGDVVGLTEDGLGASEAEEPVLMMRP